MTIRDGLFPISALENVLRKKNPNFEKEDEEAKKEVSRMLRDFSISNKIANLIKYLIKYSGAELTPEPDGDLALEWYGDGGSVFSISFNKGEIVNFARLYSDGTKIRGSTNINALSEPYMCNLISKV